MQYNKYNTLTTCSVNTSVTTYPIPYMLHLHHSKMSLRFVYKHRDNMLVAFFNVKHLTIAYKI